MLRRLLLVASAITAVPMIAAWIVSQRCLHPKPVVEDNTLESVGLQAEDITFPSRDGTRLSGWFFSANRPSTPAVILSHGHGRSRAELLPHARFLQNAGFAVLAFDYRHRGQSEGAAVSMGVGEQQDLLGAIDWMDRRDDIDHARIAVSGLSMGSVIALLVAAQDERVRAVVAECPYADHQAIMTRALRHYYNLPPFPVAPLGRWLVERRLGLSTDRARPLPVVGSIAPRQLFFIADGEDAVVGPEEALKLFEAAGEPKRYWFIPAAAHARGWQAAPDEYEAHVLDFLNEALGLKGEVAAPAPSARRSG
jgi:alpha/beta superfamily hydrolase